MIQKLGLAAASSVIALLLCELLLRLAGGEIYLTPFYPGEVTPQHDVTVDPLIGWKLPPATVLRETLEEFSVDYTTNAQGFRSRRDFRQPVAGRRIALLGDSYSFGSGVQDDESFAALLERRLANTRVDNFGIGGFGIDQMWMTLRHYALPLGPDLVILCFVRPDLDRSLSSYRQDHIWRQKPTFRLVEGRLRPMTSDSRPGRVHRWVNRHLRLYRVWRKWEHSLSRRFAVGYRWRLNRALFAAVRDDCRRAGVPLLVVHLPINRRSPVPLFASEFAELGIEFLDLTPELPGGADRLYYPRDRHLNAAGHRWVAETLYRYLAEGALLAPAGDGGVG